jgi:hypothetical protein
MEALSKTTSQVPGTPSDIGLFRKHIKIQKNLNIAISYFKSSQSMVQLVSSFNGTGEVGRVAVNTTGEVTVGNKSISVTKRGLSTDEYLEMRHQDRKQKTSPPQIKSKGRISSVSPVQDASTGVLKGLTSVLQTFLTPSPSPTVDLTSVNDKLEKLIDSSTSKN